MIDVLLVGGMGALLCCGTAQVAWRAGRSRGVRDAAADSARRLTAMAAQREAAERRARDAQAESARWNATSLAGKALSRSAVFTDRPSPRDAEELACLVRGLTLVDDVVLADRAGLPLTRQTDGASSDLAALVPSVLNFVRRLTHAGVPVLDMAFETVSATHLVARPLAGRGEGAVLVVKTTSQRANPLVIDAVAQAAVRDLPELPVSGVPAPSLAGNSDLAQVENTAFAEVFVGLEREVGDHLTAIVLTLDGRPVFNVAKDGPAVTSRAVAASAFAALADRATRTLRTSGIARIDATVRGGYVLSWAPVAPRSRLALVTFGRADARSPARTDRLLGTLRRGLQLVPSAQLVFGSAA